MTPGIPATQHTRIAPYARNHEQHVSANIATATRSARGTNRYTAGAALSTSHAEDDRNQQRSQHRNGERTLRESGAFPCADRRYRLAEHRAGNSRRLDTSNTSLFRSHPLAFSGHAGNGALPVGDRVSPNIVRAHSIHLLTSDSTCELTPSIVAGWHESGARCAAVRVVRRADAAQPVGEGDRRYVRRARVDRRDPFDRRAMREAFVLSRAEHRRTVVRLREVCPSTDAILRPWFHGWRTLLAARLPATRHPLAPRSRTLATHYWGIHPSKNSEKKIGE